MSTLRSDLTEAWAVVRTYLYPVFYILVIIVACVLAGPFWFIVPIVAFTLWFSPRFAKKRTWTLTDEAEQERKAVKELRRHLDEEGR